MDARLRPQAERLRDDGIVWPQAGRGPTQPQRDVNLRPQAEQHQRTRDARVRPQADRARNPPAPPTGTPDVARCATVTFRGHRSDTRIEQLEGHLLRTGLCLTTDVRARGRDTYVYNQMWLGERKEELQELHIEFTSTGARGAFLRDAAHLLGTGGPPRPYEGWTILRVDDLLSGEDTEYRQRYGIASHVKALRQQFVDAALRDRHVEDAWSGWRGRYLVLFTRDRAGRVQSQRIDPPRGPLAPARLAPGGRRA